MGRRRAVALLSVVAALGAPAAVRAGTLIEIDLPSDGNVDPAKVRFNGAEHPKQLKANVLLPDGYDRSKRWPVLYLLHGAGEAYTTWARKTKADEVTKGLPAIVVMPDAATGFYTNWFNGGRRGDPGWERYFLDEVIPMVERRFPIRPERRWHAVAGFSMGGFGSAYLASQRPDYFGSSGPMSGFLAPRRAEMEYAFDPATGQSYEAIYGPFNGPYVTGHDPVFLAPNLRHTRMFVITGNGVPDPSIPLPGGTGAVTAPVGEADLALHSADFAGALRDAGADVTFTTLLGVHDHPYWTDHLRRLLAWDPFKPVAERPESWTYSTIADRGRAWDVTYRFAAPPAGVQTLSRAPGAVFSAEGSGAVELCDADGRGLRATLPFAAQPLVRSVAVRVLRRSRSALRVALRAAEDTSVRLEGRVVRGRRSVRLKPARYDVTPGTRGTTAFKLTPAALALVRRGGARVRLVARHGTCPGGRWTTASRTLR